MTKTFTRRMVVLALCLTLISCTLMGGTLAKYTTTVTGSGTVEVAKWNFSVKSSTEGSAWGSESGSTSTLTLTPSSHDQVASGKIAPGTTGSFNIVLTNDSEVTASYTATFTATNKPANLKFYSDSDFKTEIQGNSAESTTTYTAGTGNLAMASSEATVADEAGNTITITVYWQWAYGDTVESDQATIATGSYDMTVNVSVTGTQVTPTTNTTTGD